jgi:hypothetical protein
MATSSSKWLPIHFEIALACVDASHVVFVSNLADAAED